MGPFDGAPRGAELNCSEIWQDGVKAYFSGLAQHQNPHRREGVDGREWREGWRFARAMDICMQIKQERESV